ncbi:MAG: phosphatidate cytidylyltransferase [bacterium]|nr:phosphatidate cytidylyltransferase [Candidatus Sumerlaeota bacterium]
MHSTTSRARMGMLMMIVILLGLRFDALAWIVPLAGWLCAMAAVFEIHKMAQHTGAPHNLPLALTGAAAFFAAGLFPAQMFPQIFLAFLLVMLLGVFSFFMLLHGFTGSLTGVPLTLFSALYTAMPMALGYQILASDKLYFLFLLILVWTSDIAAYYTGRLLGKHKMSPRISPNKTWEGSLGSVLGCLAAGAVFKSLMPAAAFSLGWNETIIASALIAVFAQIGDLAESSLKRDAGVKDSGVTLMGHGGVLDRIDSLLFSFVAFYLMLAVQGRIEF